MLNYFRITLALAAGYLAFNHFNNDLFGAERWTRAPVLIGTHSTNNFPNVSILFMKFIAADRCNSGQFAFTFDEGPSVYTAKILQAFDSRNLAASFHVLTARLNNQEQLNQLRAAINRGHIIGIRFPIDMVPNNMTEGQLISTLLSESESFNSRFGRYPRFLRFPWQQFNNTAVLIAQKMGFVVTTWSLDALDYQVASLQEIESFLKVKVLPGVPAISIHRDIYEIYNNSDNFGKLIDWVSVSQLSVVGLDKCVGVTTDLWRPDNRDPRILLLTTQPNGNKPTTVPTTAPGGGDFGGNSVSTGTGRMALLGNPWLTFILLLFSVVVLF